MSQKDKSQAAEVHVLYEANAERALEDCHDLHGQPCNDAATVGTHSKADLDRIVGFLRELGFKVEVHQRTQRIISTDFHDDGEGQ